MPEQLLTSEQYKQIVDKLLMTDDSLFDTLKEIGLGHLNSHDVEMELNQGDFGYCLNCGTWAFDIYEDWCATCRTEEQ